MIVQYCNIIFSYHEILQFNLNICVLIICQILDVEAAVSKNEASDTQGYELSPEARAQADLKFTYVVTCQIYGKQKEEQKPEAADIALLMQRYVNTICKNIIFLVCKRRKSSFIDCSFCI